MASPSSSVQNARKALGQRLREIRKQSGLSARALAALCGWHESKCSRIQNGETPPSDADIRAWLHHCGASDQIEDLLATARAVDSMYVEWRRLERAGLKHAQQSVEPLFERTRRFRAYSPWLVPGPLQTAAYTRTLLQATARQRGHDEDVEDAVTVRMERQRILYEGDHRFAVLVEEHVLRKVIGGPEAMAGQLGHLIAVGSLPSVSLGIIPDAVPRDTMRPVEGFWLFDDAQVNVELVSAYLTITQPSEVGMYAEAFAGLAQLAVYGAPARQLIAQAITALG